MMKVNSRIRTKTTIRLNPEVLRAARIEGLRQGKSLCRFVESVLAQHLKSRKGGAR